VTGGPDAAEQSQSGWLRSGGLKFTLRCVVSVALLAAIFWKVDWADLAAILLRIDVRWLVLGWGISSLLIVGLAIRWHIFLRQQALIFPLRTTLVLTWAGQFFNSVLPGSTGGDFVKIFRVCQIAPDRKAPAVATVFADRLSALVALAVLAGVGFMVEPAPLRMVFARQPPSGALLILALGLLAAVAASGWFVFRRYRETRLIGRLVRTVAAAKNNLRLTAGSLTALALAFGLHLLNFFVFYCFARALGLTITYAQMLLMMPVLLFVVMLPVTINGHGLRELLLIGYFTHFGVTAAAHPQAAVQELAVGLSLLTVANDLLWSAPGGLLYFATGRSAASPAEDRRGGEARVAGITR
jgi:uncharacterized membrane protein YbhN (UPF0104 family)